MLDLDKRSLMYLPGVGPKKAEILRKEAGISSYEDLLFYFPYKYIDRSRFYKVSEITGNMPYIQLKDVFCIMTRWGKGGPGDWWLNLPMAPGRSTSSGSKVLIM